MKIEQFIKHNLPAFDEEPASGHYERWQAKRGKQRRRTKIFLISRIAAAACITAVITITVFSYAPAPGMPEETALFCEDAPDMKNCYFDQMNAVAAQIREIAETRDSMDSQDVMIEMENLLLAGDDLEPELPEELPEEATKAILAGYYRHHLESLQSLAEQFKNSTI
ncbi:MAG: hypothetical protein LBU42_03445 [Prevotellaceae bacterium]|jgi:hypothetical protein|nr:hypothetical protein [Prevotellaceae bacterium]